MLRAERERAAREKRRETSRQKVHGGPRTAPAARRAQQRPTQHTERVQPPAAKHNRRHSGLDFDRGPLALALARNQYSSSHKQQLCFRPLPAYGTDGEHVSRARWPCTPACIQLARSNRAERNALFSASCLPIWIRFLSSRDGSGGLGICEITLAIRVEKASGT